MIRLTLLLGGALVLFAGCDGPVAPERTNPFDPDFSGNRVATPPDHLVLAEATPTSVTISWPDRSSFESGYRIVEYRDELNVSPDDRRTVIDLPPNTTTYRADGLLTFAPITFRVYSVGDGSATASAGSPLVVRYPRPQRTALIRGRGGVIVPEDELAYRGPRAVDPREVTVFSLRFAESGEEARLGQIAGYDRVVARTASGEVVLERLLEGSAKRPYAIVRGLDVAVAGVLTSPADAFVGPLVVAWDGSALAAVYLGPSGDRRLGVWDPRTGALLHQGAAAPNTGEPVLVTRAGTVVFQNGLQTGLVGWDPNTSVEEWRRGGVAHHALDPTGDRVAVHLGDGEIEIIEADGGDTEATVRTESHLVPREGLRGLRGPYLMLQSYSASGTQVWDTRTGALVRRFDDGMSRYDSIHLVEDVLTAFDGTGSGGEVFRIRLHADWERDPEAEATSSL